MTAALGFVPAIEHVQLGHPENPDRLQAIFDVFERYQVPAASNSMKPIAATFEQITSVHDPGLVKHVMEASARGDKHLEADTYITTASYEQARLAAGTTCLLAEAVMDQNAKNAFALVRPPGHHAEKQRVGGFCLFNNIAVAARHIQAKYGVERVLIIDFDVHHGNGTQDIFYADPNVLFISMHLYHPFFYPGSGSVEEIGVGPGLGATLNVPFPPGAGDASYSLALQEVVVPISSQFAPEFILVSVGFDAHWIDPLASAGLSLNGYANIASQIMQLANSTCGGRCLFVLEGGYHREALAYGALNLLYVLGLRDEVVDPLGPSPYSEPEIKSLIQQLRTLHLLS